MDIMKEAYKQLTDPEDLEDAVDKERPVPLMSPSLQETHECEKEEMKKSWSLVKNKLNERYDWLVDHVPKPIKNIASKNFKKVKK